MRTHQVSTRWGTSFAYANPPGELFFAEVVRLLVPPLTLTHLPGGGGEIRTHGTRKGRGLANLCHWPLGDASFKRIILYLITPVSLTTRSSNHIISKRFGRLDIRAPIFLISATIWLCENFPLLLEPIYPQFPS